MILEGYGTMNCDRSGLSGRIQTCGRPVDTFDATGWLDDVVRWPALLLTVGGAKSAVEAFDVDLADLDAALDELDRSDRWPVFALRVGHRRRISLVWRNFDGDAGWDYVLTSGGSSASVVASLEGGFHGPAWSWRELLDLAHQPDRRRTAAERLLILLPAMGDTDLPSTAVTVVAKAITEVGGRRHQTRVASELLAASDRCWGATSWQQIDGVPACRGTDSPRGNRPIKDLRAIADALGLR